MDKNGDIIIMRSYEFMGEIHDDLVKDTDEDSDRRGLPLMFTTVESAKNFIDILKDSDGEQACDSYIILRIESEVIV
jgi:hypothetical protein